MVKMVDFILCIFTTIKTQDKKLLYMTVKQNTEEHYHPAYVPIKIKEVSSSSFVGVNVLK